MTKRTTIAGLAAFAIVVIGAAVGAAWIYRSLSPYPRDVTGAKRNDRQDFTKIERGRYLVTAADCAACHTAAGGAPFAGGRSIETPFGNVLAANITPDRETGIGAWSDAEFDAALRLGRGRRGSFLYPAMPFVYYTKLTKDDVGAIRSYLATVTPVRNAVVSNQLPFPFNIRASMAVWDALYFHAGDFEPDPHKSEAWNRGAYLVEGPGHCGACHTPKNWLGGDETAKSLRGYSIQGWFAPNITNGKRDGLGRWSTADLATYLKSGHNKFSAATGPMAEEVSLSTSQMTDADIDAIAIFLRGQSGGAETKTISEPSSSQMKAGEAIYQDACSACHGANGEGVPNLYPDLASAPSVRAADPPSLIRVVLRGARSVATEKEPTAPAMPAFAWQLSDAQVAAVLTYLRSRGSEKASPIEASSVRSARASLAARND